MTTDNAKLVELALRCEKATEPDHLLDRDIATALGAKWAERGPFAKGFTASLDAAMTLVPEGMLLVFTNCDTKFSIPDFSRASAIVGHADDPTKPSVAATPALALCAAALRARAATCS